MVQLQAVIDPGSPVSVHPVAPHRQAPERTMTSFTRRRHAA
jgi:hypothetical protein